MSETFSDLAQLRQKAFADSDARKRLTYLFDEGSFTELDAFALAGGELTGVITAFGYVDGNPVYAFSQDINVKNGAMTEAQAKKIAKVYDLAAKTGVPVVAVYDSFGADVSDGSKALNAYGQLLALLVGCMLFVALVVDPVLVAIVIRANPYPLVFRCLRESGVTAFFTRSSAANIPVNMELCKNLGLDEEMYAVSIPLGATINMDGAAVTIAVMSLAAANTVGIKVSFTTALILAFIATLAACGASGIAGGSLLLIPMACSLFGVNPDVAMQVVAVGFIIGVVQDSVETALNSSGDVLFTAAAEYSQWKRKGKPLPGFLGGASEEH